MKTQTQKREGSCLICNTPITNPICPKCLEEEVNYWLAETKFGGDIIKGLSDFPLEKNIKCIKCRRYLSVCSYCYMREIYELLLEKDSKLAGEFIELFGLKSMPLFI